MRRVHRGRTPPHVVIARIRALQKRLAFYRRLYSPLQYAHDEPARIYIYRRPLSRHEYVTGEQIQPAAISGLRFAAHLHNQGSRVEMISVVRWLR